MRKPFFILMIIALAFTVSCGGGEPTQRGQDATAPTTTTEGTANNSNTTNKPVPADPVPTGVKHIPYVPEDEDDFMELTGGVKLYFIEKGDGVVPSKLNQKIKAHYHGMLTDGKVFDSSFDRGVPLEFPLGAVIKGWQTGLMNAPVGSRIQLVIPADQAYGAATRPGIPANSTLIFDVDLLDVQ